MTSQAVILELAGVHYAIDIIYVHEIIRLTEITPVSDYAEIEGILNLRGKVIPVIKLSRRMGLPEKESDSETRIVVVEFNGKTVGLIVDRVLEVSSYTNEEVEEISRLGEVMSFIKCIVKKKQQLWLVIDLSEVA
ncbi:MAG: hypothetical protein JL50_07235 [Peptococcaceae bacterium BICA1-7]|nr:MAG: hypothetical protein JL50_07235 [Peptococcaceae bacterium BICA1-7]HBV99140.1 chemotaxis protein CheW [Desulfotomaculum sp.]